MNRQLLECANLKILTAPVDLNTAAITGARVDMKNYERLAIVIQLGTSLTGANVVAALKQHNAASSGTSKALNVANPYYVKAGAATVFTKVPVDTAEDEYDLSATFDTDGGLIVFDVAAEDLDAENGFDWVSVDLEDGAVAKLVAVLGVAHDSAHNPPYDLAL